MICAVFLAATVAYLISWLIIRKAFLALIFSMICWMGCYFQNFIWRYVFVPLQIPHGQLLLTTMMIVLCACVAVWALRGIRNTVQMAGMILAATLVVLVINLVPVGKALYQSGQNITADIPLKLEFALDANLATPNVYWFHPDGMLGVDAVSKYYGDTQDDFLGALAERGFSVNPHANFESAHGTSCAIPVLTSPYTYDNWLSGYLSTHESAEAAIHQYGFEQRLSEIRENSELQRSFVQKGYTASLIGPNGCYYPVLGERYYGDVGMVINGIDGTYLYYSEESKDYFRTSEAVTNIMQISTYLRLPILKLASMLEEEKIMPSVQRYHTEIDAEEWYELTPNDEAKSRVYALYEILHTDIAKPRFTIIHDLTAHHPFRYNEDGTLHSFNPNISNSPWDYHAQHIWSGKLLIGMIDMILETDPDAVIVIQADHGLHTNTEKDFKRAFGEGADAIELWNSTMSAIRVPEKYQTGEEHYAVENPLNMSRYLINSFVGENYEYLHSQGE